MFSSSADLFCHDRLEVKAESYQSSSVYDISRNGSAGMYNGDGWCPSINETEYLKSTGSSHLRLSEDERKPWLQITLNDQTTVTGFSISNGTNEASHQLKSQVTELYIGYKSFQEGILHIYKENNNTCVSKICTEL